MSTKEAELFLSRGNSSSCFHLHRIRPGLQRKMDPCSTENLTGEGESLMVQAVHPRSLEGLLFSLRCIWSTTPWRPVGLLRCRWPQRGHTWRLLS